MIVTILVKINCKNRPDHLTESITLTPCSVTYGHVNNFILILIAVHYALTTHGSLRVKNV